MRTCWRARMSGLLRWPRRSRLSQQ